jgi:hypothetical protein
MPSAYKQRSNTIMRRFPNDFLATLCYSLKFPTVSKEKENDG